MYDAKHVHRDLEQRSLQGISEEPPMDSEKYIDALMLQGMLRHRLIHGEWLRDEEPTDAERLAEQYHALCRAYDAGICTGRRHGEAVPVTHDEQRLVSAHAIEVRRRLLGDHPGVSMQALHEAIIKTRGR